ncbi:MAG: hypothetical protein RI900_1235 [Actinomycetota bacterium]|jgi:catechol 2,3-dioxygenase
MTGSPLQLRLAHSTLAVRDLDRMVAFYGDVLGFLVTNRGEPVPGMGEMVFMSQTPDEHHQLVLVHTAEPAGRSFMMADHLAFRTGSLDDLRELSARLVADGNATAVPINHGNAWSVYFTDPEGNGLECFIDTPYHVAQPFADGLDLSAADADIDAATRARIESLPEYQPFHQWRARLASRLAGAED